LPEKTWLPTRLDTLAGHVRADKDDVLSLGGSSRGRDGGSDVALPVTAISNATLYSDPNCTTPLTNQATTNPTLAARSQASQCSWLVRMK
jgi:hypothetical protein